MSTLTAPPFDLDAVRARIPALVHTIPLNACSIYSALTTGA